MSLAYFGLPFFGLAYRPLAFRGSNSMAQTGFTPILHYASGTASAAPDPSFLTSSANGAELAINYTDGKLFYKDNAGAVQVLAWKTTPVTAGGTGLTSLTAGRIPFGNGTAALADASGLTYTSGTNTLSAPVVSASASMASAGNMLFSGTASRIQGDFSNVTLANRTSFQDKTTNNVTGVHILPNGTAVESAITCFNNSDPSNAAFGGISCNSTAARLASGVTGSGTAIPLWFEIAGTVVSKWGNGVYDFFGSANRITPLAGTQSGFYAYNSTDANNAGTLALYVTAGSARIDAGKTGTGSFANLAFSAGGQSSLTLTTAGAAIFGGVSGYNSLGVISAVGMGSRNGSSGSSAGYAMNMFYNGTSCFLYADNTQFGPIAAVSDYRIKKNVATQTASAMDRINLLRPVQYEFKDAGKMFKADGVTREGFIAHELQAVIPSAVEGDKDALTEDGSIQPQALRMDAIVSVLTKAVQELDARLVAIEAE
jgi:hypothetical protein